MLWPFYCVVSAALCLDYFHEQAGVPRCEAAQVGEVCYRKGKPLEVKQAPATKSTERQ